MPEPEGSPNPIARLPPFGVQIAMALAMAALFILWSRNEWGGPRVTVAFADIASTLVPLAAGWACFRRARASRADLRLAWRLIGSSTVAWGLGQAYWTWVELSTGLPPEVPSPADIGYLALLPLAAVGVALLVRRHGRGVDPRPLLDGAIVGSSFIFIAFVFGLERIVLESEATDLALIVNLLYPFGDGLVVGVALLRLSRAPRQARGAMGLLAAGFVMLAVADLWFLVVDAQGIYQTGGILDAFWIMGFQLIGLSAVRPANLLTTVDAPPQNRALALVPLYPFLLAIIASAFAETRDGHFSDTLYWTSVVVVLLVVLRLVVMLFDNFRLTEEAKSAEKALRDEKTVRVRMMNAITHDMLNAMSPIRLQLHMLQKGMLGPASDRQVQAFGTVGRNAEQMARLASDIKEASNVESGRFVLRPADMDLAATVRQAVASRQAEADGRGVVLALEAPESLPCRGDAGRLTQVVDNLLSNALKFTMRSGRILVTVACKDGEALVRVTDTGRGLSPDERARLFQPYSQVHDANEIREHGTGLGLFISRGILEGHGGRIWVESDGYGKGSTFGFRFSVPAGAPAAPQGAAGATPASA